MTTPVAATKIIPTEVHTDVEPEQILKKVADGAIFVSDVLVGNGQPSKAGARLTRLEDFCRHGVLGYATTVATAGANLSGTACATGLTAFSPHQLAQSSAMVGIAFEPRVLAEHCTIRRGDLGQDGSGPRGLRFWYHLGHGAPARAKAA